MFRLAYKELSLGSRVPRENVSCVTLFLFLLSQDTTRRNISCQSGIIHQHIQEY